jgi:hypothetical protein
MTVFRSKTFKKNSPRRVKRKLWRLARKTRKIKQHGGYVPYRANPVGGVIANVLDWDDNKEKVA